MANLIAAGEVVERPASAVKELIENAADAGASSVTVEIKNGGTAMIRVTDNGCGIASEDLETAFLRHATSKIAAPEDLNGIETMGFRGEALAAIAAVSRIEMVSKQENAELGRRILLEAGTVLSNEEAGCPNGTSVTVNDLFFNTPARYKFLKKDATEASYVENVCKNAALARPEISVRYIKDGVDELHTPGDGSLYSAVYCVFGRAFAKELLEVSYELNGVRVDGFVSKPTASRGSRGMQYFIVNDRPVKNRTVQSALEEAYRNRIMTGKFPAAVLRIGIDPHTVDVNIHPAKTEIKFSDERRVFEAVYHAVKQSLTELDRPDEIVMPKHEDTVIAEETPVSVSTFSDPGMFARDEGPFDAQKPKDVYKIHNLSTSESGIIDRTTEEVRVYSVRSAMPADLVEDMPSESEPMLQQQVLAPAKEVAPWKLIGELMGLYILVEQSDRLVLIDKHAAHERMIFNRLKKENTSVSSQLLIDTVLVKLSPREASVLLENRAELDKLGFEAEDFGNSELIVRRIPYCIDAQDTASLLSEIAEKLLNGRRGSMSVFDDILDSVACKSAIKSGDMSGRAELEKIVTAVLEGDGVDFCPHGRPVMTYITRTELEKQFRRIV